MNRIEKLATHILLFAVFAALCLNVILLGKMQIGAGSLPVAYGLYIAGAGIVRWIRGRKLPTARQLGLVLILPLAFLTVAKGMSTLYDTSWDGQDYQQSAVIALHHGWNPWYDSKLPIELPQSADYVVGYPKTTWLLQAGIYALTGRIQTATVTNIIPAFVAAILVYGVLRRLGISKAWSLLITALAVLQVHFLQQLPTFMADGYSYQLSLIAIASLVLTMLERRKTLPLLAFLSAWILLAGSKFSNLFLCALLAIFCLLYLYKTKLYHQAAVRWIAVTFAIAGSLILFVPYGSNLVARGSPLYPQNRQTETDKLRSDNTPANLKQANKLELLFYGIFSRIQPYDSGDPLSPNNVAQLKLPFTFERYEIGAINNFQGRVGSAGILFSGIMVVSIVAFALIVRYRTLLAKQRLLVGTSILIGSIIVGALVIPIPNKLRYSPLITLIPVIILVLLAATSQRKLLWVRAGKVILALFIVLNSLVSLIALGSARLHETAAISTQLQSMRQSGRTYQVYAANFYSSYTRLQEHGVIFVIDKSLSCKQPGVLEQTFGTTRFCPYKTE